MTEQADANRSIRQWVSESQKPRMKKLNR